MRHHFLPRTRNGRIAFVAFVLLFGLVIPPFTHTVLNRVDLSFTGIPFLYIALFAVYSALIAVLIWAYRKGV